MNDQDISAAVDGYLKETDAGERARASLSVGLDSNPDLEAELRQVSARTGVPMESVRAFPDAVKRQAQMASIDFGELARDFPTTTRFLGDLDNARISHDDVDNMRGFEQTVLDGILKLSRVLQAVGDFRAGTRVFKGAAYDASAGFYGALAAPFEAATSAGTRLGAPAWAVETEIGKMLRGLSHIATVGGESLQLPDVRGNVQAGLASGLQSLGSNLATLPFGIARGSATAATGLMSVVSGGSSYVEATGKGADPIKGLSLAVPDTAAEFVTEQYGMKALFDMPGVKQGVVGVLKWMANFGAKEMAGEQLATVWQDFNKWMVLNPDKTVEQFAAERPDAAIQTAIATVVGGGGQIALMGGVRAVIEAGQQASTAPQFAETLAKLNVLAEASKVRERDTGTAQAFFQSVLEESGGATEVWIAPAALAQSGLGQKLADGLPGVREQIDAAVTAQHDIRLPIADLLANFAGPDLEALIPHLASEPGGFTQTTAQEYFQSGAVDELRAEVEKALAEKQEDLGFQQSAEVVRANIQGQLDAAGRFTPQVNEAYSRLVGSWYSTLAARMGTTPEAMLERYPLKIGAQSVAGEQFEQSLAAQPPRGWVHATDAATVLDSTLERGAEKAKGQGNPGLLGDALRSLSDYESDAQTPSPDGSIGQPGSELNQNEEGPRGKFNPETLTITLLKGANLSTFLHESGHFFLEAYVDLAARPEAPAEVRADVEALLRWFGVDSLATWHALDFEEKRSYHEQFARGFEAYLYEGQTPAIEMRSLFQRFRDWLVAVYKSLKALKVELTPEVRGVMDRMLATDEQITLAEKGRSMLPLFASAEQAGMTPEEFAAYQRLGEEATAEAAEQLQARGLRDMQWLHNARGRIIKRLQKEAKEKRGEVELEVRGEVMSQPIYQAWQRLTEKPAEGGEPVARLSLPALREMGYSEELISLLKARRMTASDGVHPDFAADSLGFTSGDELVRKLAAAEPPHDEIAGLTDARMLERYGDLASPQAIEKAADEAIHNDARARMVATEANALAKATGKPRVLASAARQFAEAMVSRLKVRNVTPLQYVRAGAKAGKAAEAASRAKDLAQAAAEKRNQLINTYAARAAYGAQSEVEAGVRYLKKFAKDSATLDPEYAAQIHNLLERFDLRPLSQKAIDKRLALADWIRSQQEAGLEPSVPDDLVNEAFRKPYRELTVEEFRGLVDTVKQIEHLGRLKHKLLTAADQRAYAAVRDEIVASIHQHAQGREADTRTPTTNMGRVVQGLKRFWASHVKAATWARVMDGGKDGGPVWEYFVRPANDRGDMETRMRAEATKRLSEILAPVFKLGKMGGTGQWFPSIGRSLNREARLAIALNVGNEGNLQRLLGGEGWTMMQLMPVLQSVTPQEWQVVQSIWDHFEAYRPLIAEKEKRVYGKEPEWVAPGSPVTAQFGVRGGYYPIKYDPAASQRAEEHADAEGAKRQLQGAYTSATTRRSFTKARVEEVSGRPLLYTLAGLYSGVNDVIHDLSWHEWLIDANRLLRSQSIDGAIREHYGPEAKAQFKSWVADIAEGDKGAQAAVDVALSRLRQGVSAAGLGFNVMSAAIQPLGITQSIVRVGPTWVARGLFKMLASPIGLSREINAKSSFMANRARTRFRELNELRNRVEGETTIGELNGRYAYWLMMAFQRSVDVPTWWGAYEKAIGEGNNEARAVALADQAVIDSQGGGMTKDLSAMERGGPAQKLFTVFYSFMNTALNLGVSQTMAADTPAKKAKLAADYLLLYSVPAVLGYALKAALTPGDSGDDDPEKLARKLLANQIDYMMGLMVVVREFAEVGKTLAGANDFGRDYTGPAGLRMVSDAVALAKQASQGEFDTAFRKALINVVGDVTGLPAAQTNRSITGIQALAEGKTDNPGAIVFGFQEKR